ncbi:hypothetical protein D3C80_1287010 [compost metagenome]
MRRTIQRKRHPCLRHIGGNHRAAILMAVAPGKDTDHFGQRHGIGNPELRLRAVPAIEKRTLTLQCKDGIAHDRIVDDARHRFALDGDRKQRTESGKTGSIVESAIDGIDHEGERRIGKGGNDGLVGVIGFLTDDVGRRKPLQQRGGNRLFRENIGLGDEIDGGGFFRYGAGAQVSEAGQDDIGTGSGNGGNEEVDIFIGKAHGAGHFFIREGWPPYALQVTPR